MMTIRTLIVELYAANRGRPASTAQIMRHLTLHGYAASSVYPELKDMLKAGYLKAVGGWRSRMLHSTPTTALAAEKQKLGRPPKKKVVAKKKSTRAPKQAGPRDSEDDEYSAPFVHNLVYSRDWSADFVPPKAPRWVFDLGGRA